MRDLPVRLNWLGKGTVSEKTRASLVTSKHGDPRSVLITGDNLLALSAMGESNPCRVTLAYLDPPFLTGRRHERITRHRSASGKLVRRASPAFDDRWDGLDHYLDELGKRVSKVRDLLLPHGCLVLHVDSKTSHYAKVLCDEIFGPRAFASEIVWRYRRWPAKTQNFQRVHDVLLRYVRDPDVRPRFRQLYEPLAASTVATWGTRKQRAVIDGDGRRARSSRTNRDTPGAPLGDVWDIGILAPVSRERTGYPTQKPELLLERLVEACTDPGDLVLDPYSGSGTTAAVAFRLGRSVIAMDVNAEAIAIARDRLLRLGVTPSESHVMVPGSVRSVGRKRTSRSAA